MSDEEQLRSHDGGALRVVSRGALKGVHRVYNLEVDREHVCCVGFAGAVVQNMCAPKGIGPNDMIPEGISFDIANQKYRRFKSGDNILEYAIEGSEITVDWVSGKNASSMMKAVLEAEGAGVYFKKATETW